MPDPLKLKRCAGSRNRTPPLKWVAEVLLRAFIFEVAIVGSDNFLVSSLSSLKSPARPRAPAAAFSMKTLKALSAGNLMRTSGPVN